MTTEQAFAYGFLFRCAAEGLSAEQQAERVKAAAVDATKAVPVATAAAKTPYVGDMLRALLGLGGTLGVLGLGTGGAMGALAGYGLARAGENDQDLDEIRQQELANTYSMYAQQLRSRAAEHQRRNAAPRGYAPI